MKQILIGLHGLARSGKDTTAAYIAAHYAFLTYALASPLKAALAEMFNLTQAQIEGDQKEVLLPSIGKSPRQLMQLLGTEFGRHLVHDDLWLILAQQNIANLLDLSSAWAGGVVISDVRFENEAAWVRAQGGVVVHIYRPEVCGVNPHSSEAGIAVHDNDFNIRNDADLQHLYAQVDHLLVILLRRQALRSAA